jgi:hypothetical protein
MLKSAIVAAVAAISMPALAAIQTHSFTVTGTGGETGGGTLVWDDTVTASGSPLSLANATSISITITGGVAGAGQSFTKAQCTFLAANSTPTFAADLNFSCNNGTTSFSGFVALHRELRRKHPHVGAWHHHRHHRIRPHPQRMGHDPAVRPDGCQHPGHDAAQAGLIHTKAPMNAHFGGHFCFSGPSQEHGRRMPLCHPHPARLALSRGSPHNFRQRRAFFSTEQGAPSAYRPIRSAVQPHPTPR